MVKLPSFTRAELEALIEHIKAVLRWEKDPKKREQLIDDLVETTMQIVHLEKRGE